MADSKTDSKTDGFITEGNPFLEKLVFCDDRIKTLDETFNKKADAKNERHWFYRLLTLQAKHGFSQKKDSKSLAAAVDGCKRMNGNKKEGWPKYSERVNNMLLRQNLVDFKSTTAPNRKKTMAELKSLICKSLTNDLIPPEQAAEKSKKYPTSLEKQLLTGKLLKKKWDEINYRKTKDDNVRAHFEPIAAFNFLCTQKMNDAQVASFLNLIENESTKMKDNVTLLPFFKQDLESNKTVFGSRPIHLRIIARDMELLGKNSAQLQKNEKFLEVWASKLAKVTDLNVVFNDELRGKYLAKLKKWMGEYVKGGAESLRALILYNCLQQQESEGKYDKNLLREYLAVPKSRKYNQSVVKSKKWKRLADLNYTINSDALYAIGEDDELVYRFFRKLFQKKDEQAKKWQDVADADYLKTVLCESRLMNEKSTKGNDLKKLYTKVQGKYAVVTLQNKVIIEVERQTQRYYEIDQAVSVKVLVKNVNQLTVGVYCLNQKNYYERNGKEIDIDMNLDGLQPNYVINKTYKEDPFLARSRGIDIKELKDKRGVFLIDILGNGKRARCLIRKGYLRYIAKQEFKDDNKDGDLGYVLTVLGQQYKAIKSSRITLGDNCYDSDEKGNVYIPFAKDKDQLNCPIILEDLTRGTESATLQFFDFQTENYTSESALYVDRETLLEAQTAKIVVRPLLFLNAQPVSCTALKDPSLLVRAFVGAGDKQQSVMIKKFRLRLNDKRETVVDYDVPSELRKIEITLSGKVWSGSQNKDVVCSNSSTFEVNAIDDSTALGQCLLIPFDSKYLLKIVGKNAEAIAGAKVLLKLKHRYFKKCLEYKLQSNDDGMIKLGELPDIECLEVIPENNNRELFASQHFRLPNNCVNIPTVINVNQGDDVLIPLISENIAPRCDVYDTNFIRIFENVQFNAGYIKIAQLPAGNFVAMLRDTQCVDIYINVSKGVGVAGCSVGQDRIVELSEKKSLQIVSTKGNRGNGYKVKLDGYNSDYTRVHAVSSFGVPAFNAFEFLASPVTLPQIFNFPKYPLGFTADCDVSAEENYVYRRREVPVSDEKKGDDEKDSPDRKLGNVLSTPSLLLNRWTTEGAAGCAANAGGDADAGNAGAQANDGPQARAQRELKRYAKADRTMNDPSNMNILGNPACIAYNLEPDKNGVVSIPGDILEENHNLLTIIALDDNNTSIKYEKLKPIAKVPYTDTRLSAGLDPKKHYSEVREVLLKQKDECVTFNNWASTTLETYDDFSDVFELYYSIADKNGNTQMCSDLSDFQFLANWCNYSDKEKIELYDQYSCNELNLFLQNKDKKFFKKVVATLLQNRLQKSFFDHYLLGNKDAVKKYVKLDLYHTLNVVEKIMLASVVGGKLAENTVQMLRDVVSLRRDQIQEFNALFEQALHAKQFEVTSLSNNSDAADAKDEEANASDDLARQYQEARYYRVNYSSQSDALVSENAFWLDYAQYLLGKSDKKGFLSANFGFAANSTTEALLALSVISLPFRGDHEAPTVEIMSSENAALKSYKEGATVKVTVNGPTMLLARQVSETTFQSSSLAVSTNYFDPVNRFETVDFERVDKFVNQSQLVSGRTYGCRVVITNVSSINYSVELLCQIPTGAIPVNGGFRTKNFVRELNSYATSSIEYFFYFPLPGSFAHYPAHISRNGEVIGYSLEKTEVGVVDESVVFDRSSFEYISSSKAEEKECIEYIKTNPELRVQDLSKLAWKCADEKFFKEVTNILRRKHLYNADIWKYAMVHSAEVEVAECLLRNDKFMALLAPALTAENTGDPLFINYNAYERNTYRHVEFFKKESNIIGLFNSRIHDNSMLNRNEQFEKVYRDFLIRCLYRSHGIKTLPVDDQICCVFYLIAQNRVKEANDVYKAIDSKTARKLCAMLYDYIGIFLAFLSDDPKKALEKQDCVHKYLQSKLPPSKKRMWESVRKQLAELQDFKKSLNEFQDTNNAKKSKLAQPKLGFVIDSNKKSIRIKSKNLKEVVCNFYAINIEELFSNAPFTAGKDALSVVQPSITVNVKTTKKEEKKKDSDDESSSDDEEVAKKKKVKKVDPNADIISTIPYPKGLGDNANFVLEALGAGTDLRVAKTQYNNSLYVEFSKKRKDMFVGNYSKFAIPKAYVKVYIATAANPNGFFLKDGYTDMRGRFRYLFGNVGLPDDVTSAAVLVVTGKCGSNIYYVDL